MKAGNDTTTAGPATNGTSSNGTGTNSTAGGEGTNIFTGKQNSSDAAGLVGPLNFSISNPPYIVERCDQVLLLPGKKLNLKDYCSKEDAFMTLSIYMANLFLTKDSNKLIESIPMDQVTQLPSKLPGAPSCTTYQTRFKSFAFCYETEQILDQVIEAYKEFFRCRKGIRPPSVPTVLVEACDLGKIDFSENGPFGKQGPIYKSMIDEHKNSADGKGKSPNGKVNPYYNLNRVPGS